VVWSSVSGVISGLMLVVRDVMAEQRRTYERWRNGPVDVVRDVGAWVLKV